MVFTARDTEKESKPMGINQPGRFSRFCDPGLRTANSPTSVNDAASARVSKLTVCFSSAYPGILMLRWKELL